MLHQMRDSERELIAVAAASLWILFIRELVRLRTGSVGGLLNGSTRPVGRRRQPTVKGSNASAARNARQTSASLHWWCRGADSPRAVVDGKGKDTRRTILVIWPAGAPGLEGR
jgi:hypothetical protein